MVTAVDSSILLALLLNEDGGAETALARAHREGELIVCETVVAEVTPEVGAAGLAAFLADLRIRFQPSSFESARLAGELYALYLRRGGRRGRIVPDFLIGAHAKFHADRLLVRDFGFLRDYFKGLKVMEPG
jgi:predicted nucleic acid-binding protein